MIDSLLKIFNIEHKYRRSEDVDPSLSTYLKLKESKKYNFGKFIKRYLNRIDVVDDFRFDGIACAQYVPPARKMRILVNPLNLWDRIIRPIALKNTDISYSPEIQEIDRIVVDAFKDNGWTEKNFDIWVRFLLKYELPHMSKTFYNYNKDILDKNLSIPTSAVLIHEFLHCAWQHCSSPRRTIEDESTVLDNKITNVAMDFSINQTLTFGLLDEIFMTTENKKILEIFKSGGAPMKEYDESLPITIECFSESFLNQPYEYYYSILKNADQTLLEELLGKSNLRSTMFKLDPDDLYEMFKHKIGNMTEEEIQQMRQEFGLDSVEDFEDFNPTPSEIKKISNNDIKRIVDEMLRKGEINNPEDALRDGSFDLNDSFGKLIKKMYRTETKPWDHLLRHEMTKIIGHQDFDYTMKRESRAISGMFPGKSRERGLDLILVEDVSGSINYDDWNRFKNEMIRATRELDNPTVRYIQFHSQVAFDQLVPISKLRDIGIKETGGTSMKVPLEKLKNEGNTKTTIVFTDGWVETGYNQSDFPFKIIIFVSASGNERVCYDLANRGFTVISQDGDNEWMT
jgi:hypothetical protein